MAEETGYEGQATVSQIGPVTWLVEVPREFDASNGDEESSAWGWFPLSEVSK
jgi:hypothetical protein